MGTNYTIGNRGVLSSFWLKRIAIISMVIDHIGSIVIRDIINRLYVDRFAFYIADNMPFLIRYSFLIRNICDVIGSIAFPIFCFLIAEGFTHTRSPLKYGLRMGLFALLSEIPFDLAHYKSLWNFSLQNVMFTLCVGIFSLYAVSLVEERYRERPPLRWGLTVFAIAAGMGLAFLLRGEYVFLGVLTICLLYLLRNTGWVRLLGFAPLLIVSPWILLALIPVSLYNGERGRGSKYFFYVFYPAHFLVLAGISGLLIRLAK